jgi:hypothetical protein
MAVNTAAGSRLFIGPVPAASVDTAAEYAALTPYVEVGEVEDLGEFGDEAGSTTFTALGDRRVRKFKTTFDAGTMTVTCGSDPADAGQQAMIAALASDLDYSFKVVLNDEVTSDGDPTELYFKGKVMSKRRNVGNVENVVRQAFTVGINSEIYEVAAS